MHSGHIFRLLFSFSFFSFFFIISFFFLPLFYFFSSNDRAHTWIYNNGKSLISKNARFGWDQHPTIRIPLTLFTYIYICIHICSNHYVRLLIQRSQAQQRRRSANKFFRDSDRCRATHLKWMTRSKGRPKRICPGLWWHELARSSYITIRAYHGSSVKGWRGVGQSQPGR